MANYKSHDNCKPRTLWKGYYLSNAKRQENGKAILDTDWSERGKPRIVDDSTLADIIADLLNETGRMFGKEDVNKLITKHCRKG